MSLWPRFLAYPVGLQENHGITITVNTVTLGVCRDSWAIAVMLRHGCGLSADCVQHQHSAASLTPTWLSN